MLAAFDPWILAFSLVTVAVTIWMGFRSAKTSKSASDFFVAGRSVSVGWNASAISGEYLSAASFMGVAGMVMSSGYDALWYPVCYACGYLFLLLFIAGPLRRFGAYTIPDFAEGRYDSPLFRKIAVIFVLFIGFFYTMPQMKGAGTTLAYIFPGLPYWVGVVLVGAVITLNVALGGMKGITLVQAFQYWAKMFAISVPIFVLMSVYGGYGKQVGVNGDGGNGPAQGAPITPAFAWFEPGPATDIPAAFRVGNQVGPLKLSAYRELSFGPITNQPWNICHLASNYVALTGKRLLISSELTNSTVWISHATTLKADQYAALTEDTLQRTGALSWVRTNGKPLIVNGESQIATNRVAIVHEQDLVRWLPLDRLADYNMKISDRLAANAAETAKLPADATWRNSSGPLTTNLISLSTRMTVESVNGWVRFEAPSLTDRLEDRAKALFGNGVPYYMVSDAKLASVLIEYARFSGKTVVAHTNLELPRMLGPMTIRETNWSGVVSQYTSFLTNHGVFLQPAGSQILAMPPAMAATLATAPSVQSRLPLPAKAPKDETWLNPFGPLTTKAAKAAKLDSEQAKPYALLYTYSLIIALVCGTAGLPHILVRFYTNPDGVAAKRTTMWVMILIGIFYVFPPVFGVMGRNLMPSLYEGTGAKGTDKVVLELPKVLDSKDGGIWKIGKQEEGKTGVTGSVQSSTGAEPASQKSQIANRKSQIPWGSILSGITCAGAFAAFMSTFSGLLVSMTGALAHDVYGRMLRPNSTPAERMRMFKFCAVAVGTVAVVLGSFVEPLQINFMVGQAFAIAAASYFPLLFMSVWWRGMTMRGAAAGMLTGGVCALAAVTLTNFSDLKWIALSDFWAAHPLLRILCEQPAIWTVPLAIGLMVAVSKLTRATVPADVRMKMLVLHAPEKLGLKQEYIKEHEAHGH